MEKHKVQLLLLLLVRRLKERTLYSPVLHAALALIVFKTIFKAFHPAAKKNKLMILVHCYHNLLCFTANKQHRPKLLWINKTAVSTNTGNIALFSATLFSFTQNSSRTFFVCGPTQLATWWSLQGGWIHGNNIPQSIIPSKGPDGLACHTIMLLLFFTEHPLILCQKHVSLKAPILFSGGLCNF